MDVNEQVDQEFSRARRRAFLRRMRSFLRNDPVSNQLLSFDDVREAVGFVGQTELGIQTVEVEKIIGSVGRHRDFDRAFLPIGRNLEERWKRVAGALYRSEELPPISLYRLGDAYFVRDGHHRVSVAKQQGMERLEANVTELRTRLQADNSLTLPGLLHKREQLKFLERLPVDRVAPELRLELSDAADYRRLATRIEAHGFRLSQAQQRMIAAEEAIEDWYRRSYLPVLRVIREENILEHFPGRTELDLYMWIIAHRENLSLQYDENSISADAARESLRSGQMRRKTLR